MSLLKSIARFRLITFDVTDTLLKFRTSPGKQYGEIGALFGARCDSSELAKHFNINWYKMNKQYPNFGRNSSIEWQLWWRELIAETFAASGAPVPAVKLENFSNHLLELYKTTICWQHCNGSLDLLNLLKETHPTCKLGIIANFDPRLQDLLRNMKIDQYFDFVINSYDARVEKPAAEIYAAAIKATGLPKLEPDECLHIGDGPTTDYLGAKTAGWNAALIHEKSFDYLREKYGEKIQKEKIFHSLYDFHKKLIYDAVVW